MLALAVRTVSWTTESARERQHLRGRRRWYDGPLTVASSPWYLVVATGGTLMLLLWSAFVAFVVGFAYLLFRGPLVPGLLVMGAVFATSLWWGPAARRLRVPTRRLMLATTRNPWLGWVGVLVVGAAARPAATRSSPAAWCGTPSRERRGAPAPCSASSSAGSDRESETGFHASGIGGTVETCSRAGSLSASASRHLAR